MADNQDQKTEKATPQKLRKARTEGRIPRSKEIGAAAGLLLSLKILALCMPGYLDDFRRLFGQGLPLLARPDALDGATADLFYTTLFLLFKMLLPLCLIPAGIIIASMLPGGWMFSWQMLMPKPSRLDPVGGLARLWSLERLTDVARAIAKALLLGVVLFFVIRKHLDDFYRLQQLPLTVAIPQGAGLILDLCFAFAAIFILFAAIDLPLQMLLFLRSMRMSKQEIKEEFKSSEGKPEVRQRIRQLQRQLARRGLAQSVPTADVVLTNPTRYAVALKYDEARAEAPFIVAKGQDEMALFIRDIARQHAVEIVEVPPLARAIYHTTRVNQQIPAALYKAVAHVLSYVLQLDAFRKGRRDSRPSMPSDLAVPRELSEKQPT